MAKISRASGVTYEPGHEPDGWPPPPGGGGGHAAQGAAVQEAEPAREPEPASGAPAGAAPEPPGPVPGRAQPKKADGG